MARSRLDPQDRAIKVLVGIIKSHQGLLGVVRQHLPPHNSPPIPLRRADEVVAAAGLLLNDLRMGEVKVTAWEMTAVLWCVECGHNWEGEPSGEECPECGGQCSDV